jgi:uncharacterized protein
VPAVFLDTNILLRHLLQDHPEHSRRATAFFGRVERGEIQARIIDTVIFEAVFTLERTYKQSKRHIRGILLPLVELPGILLSGKDRMRRVFDLYVDQDISFADALHASAMVDFGLNEIITFDTDFDRISGIRRIEP